MDSDSIPAASTEETPDSSEKAGHAQGAVRVPVRSAGPLPDFYPALAARIRAQLEPDPDHPGCLVWRGAGSKGGKHGRLKFQGKLYAPHRVLLEAKLGHLLPRSIDACHECDNPPCCLEAHLWAGTRAANVNDAIEKGRLRPPPHDTATALKRAVTRRANAMPWTAVPAYVCTTMRDGRCDLCGAPIVVGQRYYDRGRSHAHEVCGDAADGSCALPTARPGQEQAP
jgi:hypothetical protein